MNGNCFELVNKTDVEPDRLICARYWEINDKMAYSFSVQDLVVEFGLTGPKITELVRRNSVLRLCCLGCGSVFDKKDENSDLFRITLQETFFRSGKQPHYSGCFKVKEEKTFRPTDEYRYGAWINDDGTIFLVIEPA